MRTSASEAPLAGPDDFLVAGDLRAVRGCLLAFGATGLPCGEVLTGHLTDGKLLRAQLVLHAAALGSARDGDAAVRYAAFIECIHAGALCHDDVVDRSQLRRGRPTVDDAFGPRVATLAGLFLMVRALEILANDDIAVRRAVARALRDVARGQTDELNDLFAASLSPEACLRRAYDKTGALYELAGWLGATAGRLEASEIDAVARCAAGSGLAFQLADDLRDFVGGSGLGREPGTDVRAGVYTLPILLTLAGRCPGGETLGAVLGRQGAPDGFETCAELLRDNGAFEAVARSAARATEDAIAALGTLRPSDARNALQALVRRVGTLPALDRAVVRRSREATGAGPCASPHPAASERPLDPGSPVLLARPRSPLLSDAVCQVRAHAAGHPFGNRAATAVALTVTLAELANAVRTGAGQETWAANASLIATIDLLVADLFALTSALPSAVVEPLAHGLGGILRAMTGDAAGTEDRSVRLPERDLLDLARLVGRAAA